MDGSAPLVAEEQGQRLLFVVNAPPYGDERSYNALRHATVLSRHPDAKVRIFFMADAAMCARKGQKTPDGYYNISHMVAVLVRSGARAATCGTCMDARALADGDLVSGVQRGSMDDLRDWTLWADKIVVY